MSESEIIKVYQEGIQSVISLVQGLSTQISELSQTVSDYRCCALKNLKNNQIKQVKTVVGLPQPMALKDKNLRQPSNKKRVVSWHDQP